MLTPALRDALHAYSDLAAPLESCGFLWPTSVVMVQNTDKRLNRFAMNPAEAWNALEELGPPYGVWHSHPEGQEMPSDDDCHGHASPLLALIIVTPTAITEWRLDSGMPIRVGEL